MGSISIKRSSSKPQAMLRAQEMYSLGYSHSDVMGMLVGKYLYDHASATSIARGAKWRNEHKGELNSLEKTNSEMMYDKRDDAERGIKRGKDGIIEEN